MTIPQTPPEDIKPKWFSVVRSMISSSQRDNKGLAIVTMHILVDATGNPVFWSEPNVTKIEPRGSVRDILAMLSNDFGKND